MNKPQAFAYPHISVAPMMQCTDRHYRYLARAISPHIGLYTEMVTTATIRYGDARRLLAYDPVEHWLGLQLGGRDPDELAFCAKLAQQLGYDEVNLNVGCPSRRTQSGGFGACLFKDPTQVARCVEAMHRSVDIPVTVKTRIGVDDYDDVLDLHRFLDHVMHAGCRTVIIHARKAWLKGLNPHQNRSVPPLDYERVFDAKRHFPECTIVINGGIKTVEHIRACLERVDGVMIGRAAYDDPLWLATIEEAFYAKPKQSSLIRRSVLDCFMPYIEEQLRSGVRLYYLVKPLLGLLRGFDGAKRLRSTLMSLTDEAVQRDRLVSQVYHLIAEGLELRA